MDKHIELIKALIRKNNIFGERDDPIIRAFLHMGGTAAFYDPIDDGALYGRSSNRAYTARRVENKAQIAELTSTDPFTHIYYVNGKVVKFYGADGRKLPYV